MRCPFPLDAACSHSARMTPSTSQEAEPAFVRNMKLDVLAALANAENSGAILREFTRYVKDDDKVFVKRAIQAIVRIANSLPSIADRCLRGLMALVTTDNDAVVAEGVIAIRQLLQQHPQHDTLVTRLTKRLPLTASPSARAAIVWILGEFQSKPRVAAMAPDALRQLAKGFRNEATEVKYQILNLAAKTALWHADSAPVGLLLKYILELARYDADYDLRDRARTLRVFMLGDQITAIDAEALEAAGEVIAVGAGTAAGVAGFTPAVEKAIAASEDAPSEGAAEGAAAPAEGEATTAAEASADAPPSPAPVRERASTAASPPTGGPVAAAPQSVTGTLRDRVRAVLLASKPPPAIDIALTAKGAAPALSLASLSFMVAHPARGYLPLPEWAPVSSSPSLRDPPSDEPPTRKGAKKPKAKAPASSDEDEDDEDEDDESDDDDEESEEEESEEESD